MVKHTQTFRQLTAWKKYYDIELEMINFTVLSTELKETFLHILSFSGQGVTLPLTTSPKMFWFMRYHKISVYDTYLFSYYQFCPTSDQDFE